ncbi:MAG: ATP-binding protein [Bacteroidales bacterium]|nr:ATP-binding protein [Bacteroidales bacterium]
MIKRVLDEGIKTYLFRKKAIIVLGPRQSGKTTLIKQILEDYSSDTILLNGDDPTIQQILTRPNTEQIKQIIGNKKLVFIDEAQRIKDIGITSKIVVDNFPVVQIILSGSSAFELSQSTNEPLTGRKWSFQLWPVSWEEWQNHIGYLESEMDLENRLVFGFYPDVLNNRDNPVRVINELIDSYLYKDVLMYGNLKKPEEIQKLLQAISWQVGSEVSYRELGEIINLDPKTVERYISILEKAFVLFKLPSFSRNLRNEIKLGKKIYFFDNGIRNGVIGQFMMFQARQDKGAIWENFLMSERQKFLNYTNSYAKSYFWRTVQQQEIDYIEEVDGKLYAYEFKLNEKRKVKFSTTFTNNYSAEYKLVNRSNFRDFVIQKNT